jgi:hypothetical protein
MNFEIDHIDPTWKEGRDYQLVCGLDIPINFCEREERVNQSKSNRFLPWRVCSGELGDIPVNPGDLCQFLDPETGEWVLEEFMGEWWFERTKKFCGQSVAGNVGAKSGHLLRIAPLGSSEVGRKVGKRMFEEKKGLFAPGAVTREMLSFAGKRAAEVTKQTGTGLYGVPIEVKRENGVNSMKMKYMDPGHPELGQHAAPILVQKQRRKGYPSGKENRVRVE